MKNRVEYVLNDRNKAVYGQYKNSLYRKDQEKICRQRQKKKIILTAIAVISVLSLIYVPQFFVKNEYEAATDIIYDTDAIGTYREVIKNNPELDFDEDGVCNSVEIAKNLNLWNKDTDKDGVTDMAEQILKTNPEKKDNNLVKINEKLLTESDTSYDLAYRINGVTLWSNNIKSRTYGIVIRTVDDGYQFLNFDGYAEFPEGTYVYLYKNGIHIPLNNKKNGAYRIKEDCLVYSLDEKLEMTNKFTFLGFNIYSSDNIITKILSYILPDKGFVTGTRMAKNDINADVQQSHSIMDFTQLSYSSKPERFTKNDNSLENMALLRQIINEKNPVAVSLFDDTKGEYIGIIYGYTESGDLLVCDKRTYTYVGKLKITMSAEVLFDGTELKQYEYYDFAGLGFDSKKGSRISFLHDAFY